MSALNDATQVQQLEFFVLGDCTRSLHALFTVLTSVSPQLLGSATLVASPQSSFLQLSSVIPSPPLVTYSHCIAAFNTSTSTPSGVNLFRCCSASFSLIESTPRACHEHAAHSVLSPRWSLHITQTRCSLCATQPCCQLYIIHSGATNLIIC
jgi:hypothetical protein